MLGVQRGRAENSEPSDICTVAGSQTDLVKVEITVDPK
jgi:hypothetical protein